MQVSKYTVRSYCNEIERMMLIYDVPSDVQVTIRDYLEDIQDTVEELERTEMVQAALVRNVPPAGTECTCGKCKENK